MQQTEYDFLTYITADPAKRSAVILTPVSSLPCSGSASRRACVKDKKQRAQPHAEHKRRVYLPIHSLGVMRAPALGNDNARAGARFCVNLQQIRQYTCDFMREFCLTVQLFCAKATAQRCVVLQFVISPNKAGGLRQISCIFCIVLLQRLKKINTVVN